MIRTYGEGITWVPLHWEVGSLRPDDESVVVGQRARRNGVATESRIDVRANCGTLATGVVLSSEVMCVDTAKDILCIALSDQITASGEYYARIRDRGRQ